MGLDGLLSYGELRRDLFVRLSAGDQLENLRLPLAQCGRSDIRCAHFANKTGGGLGYILAIVVLVILLVLAARAWRGAAPAAAQALKPGASGSISDHGETGAGQAVRSGNLPDLKKTGRSTDDHVEEINQVTKGQD